MGKRWPCQVKPQDFWESALESIYSRVFELLSDTPCHSAVNPVPTVLSWIIFISTQKDQRQIYILPANLNHFRVLTHLLNLRSTSWRVDPIILEYDVSVCLQHSEIKSARVVNLKIRPVAWNVSGCKTAFLLCVGSSVNTLAGSVNWRHGVWTSFFICLILMNEWIAASTDKDWKSILAVLSFLGKKMFAL